MREESEREVRERIEATRRRMGDTMEQIGDRVNPDRVQREIKARARSEVDELKHNVKRKARNAMDDVQHEVRETSRGIWDTIRDNPVPAGMVGMGLAWLLANGARDSDHSVAWGDRDRYTRYTGARVGYAGRTDFDTSRGARFEYPRSETVRQPGPRGTYDPGYGAGESFEAGVSRASFRDEDSSAVDSARETGEEMVDSAKQGAREAKHRAEEAVDAARETGEEMKSEAKHRARQARDQVSDWAHDVEYGARRAERKVEDSVKENPMAAGAVALALGFAAGMLVPETDAEREMMGPARDRVMDRAQDAARSAADRAHDTVREKAGTAARKAVDEAWETAEDKVDPDAMTEPRR